VDGDLITIDAQQRRLDVAWDDHVATERRRRWQPPPLKATRGVLFKYIQSVKPASLGCVTDE
jgi:dihydroxy-acid dehydratase